MKRPGALPTHRPAFRALIARIGTEDVLGLGVVSNEGAKFWLRVMKPGDRSKLASSLAGRHSVLAFSKDVHRIIYTANAFEALNFKPRRAVHAGGHFPNDDAALKLLFVVLDRSEKE